MPFKFIHEVSYARKSLNYLLELPFSKLLKNLEQFKKCMILK